MPILRNDKGYYVIISGRCGITYIDEQNKKYILDAEMVNSPLYDFVVSSKSIVTSGDAISDIYRKKIIQRVSELCSNNNIKLLITDN